MFLIEDKKLNIKVVILTLLYIAYISAVAINNKLLILAIIPYIFLFFSRCSIISVIFLVIINESLFYLIKDTRLNGFMIILTIITLLVSLFKTMNKNNSFKFLFEKNIYMIILLVLFEVFISYIYTGQNIILGIYAAQRYFLYLLYFYINISMNNRENAEKIVDILIYISTFISILYIIQAMLYPSIIVFDMRYSIRHGNVRFYTGITLIIFGMLLAIERYMYTKKNKYLLCIGFTLLEIYAVGQTRSIIIPLIMILVYKLFDFKKVNSKKIIFILVFLATVSTLIMSNSEFIDKFFISVYEEIMSSSGTSGVRLEEINFYLRQFLKSPICGVGIYNDSWEIGYYMLGKNFKFFQNDIGVIGFLPTFGVFGMSIFAMLVYRVNCTINRTPKVKYGKLMVYFIVFSLPFCFYLENNTSILYLLITICYIEKKYIWSKEDESRKVAN